MHISKTHKITLFLLFCILIQASTIQAQSVYKIFVDVNGNNKANGTQTHPVNNIAKALQIANAVSKKNIKQVQIIVRAGTYHVDQSLEIIQDKNWNSTIPLSIQAYNKDIVILHGGKTISSSMIKPVSDQSYLSRFQPNVKDRIREINLKEAGIDPGKLKPVGMGRPFGPSWMEMFVNGKPGQIARWPNTGTVPIDSVISAGSVDADKTVVEKKGGVFFYKDPRPSRWKEPQNVWISGFFMWGYCDDAVPLKSIDTVKKIITTALSSRYGFGTGKPWRAYYAYNMPEEIDVPGEYYVDDAKGMLYFLPPDTLKNVELSVLEAPILQAEGVRNLRIKNIQFTCSRGMGIYTEKTTGLRIDGCTFTNLGMMAVFVGKAMPDPAGQPQPKARVEGDILSYMYNNTVFDSQGGSDNGILNCVIYQTGAGGIYLNGGNRVTLTASHSFVKNCLIHDFNRISKTYKPAIVLTGVGNTISNCEIYNSPSVCIMIHGNNHLIEYNNIHNATLEVDDMGAIYYGRDPSERGNVVRYNYLHDIGGTNKTEGVYHDDGACGMLVTGNVFYNAGTVAAFIGGGQDNVYINNIFLNNRYAIHIDERLTNWAKGVLQDGGLFQTRLNLVNYSKPPYATAYPLLKDYFKGNPAMPKGNKFDRNVMFNNQHLIEGDSTLLHFDKQKNYIATSDPGFEDYANKNFRLKKNSIIYKMLPGFVAPPLDKMGYHKVN